MKTITFILSLLLIPSCAHVSTSSSPVNIDGTWEGEYDSGIGGPPMLFTFNFMSDGESLGGFVRNESIQGEWTQLENFKIRGSNISFTSRPKNTKMIFKFKGKVDGDKVKMTFTVKKPGPNWWKTPRSKLPRSMIDNGGELIRSSDYIEGSTQALSAGVDRLNSQSGEFTIMRVK